ncbi:MAG: glycosyltransferase family 4 protein [Deltaproteobacteria bacterium]|nr:glycosyltransferase family 4 protein [Deltaproteobacteria bacterium]
MTKSRLKVLIAHHRWWYPTAVSGADLANHEFARKLIEKGVELRVHGITPPDLSARADRREYHADGIPVSLVRTEFSKRLRAVIREFKPDVVLTSCPEPNCGADDMTRMVETINRAGLPVVLYVHNIETTLPLFKHVKNDLAKVVTNSEFMAGRINEIWKTDSEVVYPVPDWKPIQAEGSDGSFITFFNPVPHKGLGIAHTLVTVRFKNRPFLFVEGFIDPEDHGIALTRSGNLVHARRSPDVAAIYMMTRTVVIPSQWEEPFGRVALEAMYNRIPVIASRTGGLPESVGDGGILIDEFSDVDCWVEAIERLDDPKERRRAIEAGKKHVKKFSLDLEADKLLEILRNI